MLKCNEVIIHFKNHRNSQSITPSDGALYLEVEKVENVLRISYMRKSIVSSEMIPFKSIFFNFDEVVEFACEGIRE